MITYFFRFLLSLNLILLSFAFLGCSSSSSDSGGNSSLITVPVSVVLMSDITMDHPQGVSMTTWMNSNDMLDVVIPEVNSIWSVADIRFSVQEVRVQSAVSSPNAVTTILNSTRASSNSDRVNAILALINPSFSDVRVMVYVLPFIGNTYQGLASFSQNGVILGGFSNKHTNGNVPERVLLVEPQDAFDRGSLARTLAHELGHVLSLQHRECSESCLMGGTVSDGYQMTEAQILAARESALRFLLE